MSFRFLEGESWETAEMGQGILIHVFKTSFQPNPYLVELVREHILKWQTYYHFFPFLSLHMYYVYMKYANIFYQRHVTYMYERIYMKEKHITEGF